jgi:hypothetical protein
VKKKVVYLFTKAPSVDPPIMNARPSSNVSTEGYQRGDNLKIWH